jgi:hypothetical protein
MTGAVLTCVPAGGAAGAHFFPQGTAVTPPANSVGPMAPASVPTAYAIILPGAPAAGYVKRTGANPSVESVGAIASADVPVAIDTRTVAFTDIAPVAGDDGLITILDSATAIHLTRVSCGVGGTTSVVVNLVKGGASLIADMTATAGDANTVIATTWANGSSQCGGTSSCAVAAHAPVTVHIGTISGTPTALSCAVDYTVD